MRVNRDRTWMERLGDDEMDGGDGWELTMKGVICDAGDSNLWILRIAMERSVLCESDAIEI